MYWTDNTGRAGWTDKDKNVTPIVGQVPAGETVYRDGGDEGRGDGPAA